jgi:hypothetical protein
MVRVADDGDGQQGKDAPAPSSPPAVEVQRGTRPNEKRPLPGTPPPGAQERRK